MFRNLPAATHPLALARRLRPGPGRLPIDPQADVGRRAWVACPGCDDTRGCAGCAERRNCREHWRYLLSHTGSVLHLQCPTCTHVWDHETGFGATRHHVQRPA
ncbi:hypothetical protein [Kitasatospora sp. NPDC091207]|uniref:hypothetical protein n=1 Tax=Kitasatospora sp. NPDC091207 TaxID=3364083 RepID=UPI0037FA90C7